MVERAQSRDRFSRRVVSRESHVTRESCLPKYGPQLKSYIKHYYRPHVLHNTCESPFCLVGRTFYLSCTVRGAHRRTALPAAARVANVRPARPRARTGLPRPAPQMARMPGCLQAVVQRHQCSTAPLDGGGGSTRRELESEERLPVIGKRLNAPSAADADGLSLEPGPPSCFFSFSPDLYFKSLLAHRPGTQTLTGQLV